MERPDTRPVVAPPYLFLPHPTERGLWIRTDVCVAMRACPICHVPKGVLCKGDPENEIGTVNPHYARRTVKRSLKAPLMLKLAQDRDYRFPGAPWFIAREFEQTSFRTMTYTEDCGEETEQDTLEQRAEEAQE